MKAGRARDLTQKTKKNRLEGSLSRRLFKKERRGQTEGKKKKNTMPDYKIVVLGSGGVGKSALVC